MNASAYQTCSTRRCKEFAGYVCNISTYRTYCKSTRHGVDRLKSDPGNHHRCDNADDDDDIGQGGWGGGQVNHRVPLGMCVQVYCTTT